MKITIEVDSLTEALRILRSIEPDSPVADPPAQTQFVPPPNAPPMNAPPMGGGMPAGMSGPPTGAMPTGVPGAVGNVTAGQLQAGANGASSTSGNAIDQAAVQRAMESFVNQHGASAAKAILAQHGVPRVRGAQAHVLPSLYQAFGGQ